MILPPKARHACVLITVCAVTLLAGCATVSEQDRYVLQERGVPTALYDKMLRREPLNLLEIIQLSARKVPPAFLVRYIDESLVVYDMTTDEVLLLKNSGVSHEVIDFLLATPHLHPNTVVRYQPYPAPVYRPIIIQRGR